MAEGTEAEAGVVVHFAREYEGGTLRGDVSRGPTGLVITRVEVSAPAETGVTLRLLRGTPLGEVLTAVRAHAALEDARRQGTRAILGEEPVPGVLTEDATEAPQTSGRTPMTEDLLRKVAMAYLDETGPGKDRRAIQRLAARFERPEGTVRTWVGRARKEGWLGPGAKGRMGAEPGPKLLAWMGQQMNKVKPILDEASRIAMELGATTSGEVRRAIRAYDDEAERKLARQTSVNPLVACIASEILFGKPLSAEVGSRSEQKSISPEAALREVGQEVTRLVSGKGLTVTLPAVD